MLFCILFLEFHLTAGGKHDGCSLSRIYGDFTVRYNEVMFKAMFAISLCKAVDFVGSTQARVLIFIMNNLGE